MEFDASEKDYCSWSFSLWNILEFIDRTDYDVNNPPLNVIFLDTISYSCFCK